MDKNSRTSTNVVSELEHHSWPYETQHYWLRLRKRGVIAILEWRTTAVSKVFFSRNIATVFWPPLLFIHCDPRLTFAWAITKELLLNDLTWYLFYHGISSWNMMNPGMRFSTVWYPRCPHFWTKYLSVGFLNRPIVGRCGSWLVYVSSTTFWKIISRLSPPGYAFTVKSVLITLPNSACKLSHINAFPKARGFAYRLSYSVTKF